MLGVLLQQGGSYLGFDDQGGAGNGPLIFLGVLVGVGVLMFILRSVVKGRRAASRGNGTARRRRSRASRTKAQHDLSEFTAPILDMDPLIDPPSGRPRPIPPELGSGTVLVSQRLGVKCLLIDDLEQVGRRTLKEICARKLTGSQAIYMPMGSQIYRDEILHQGRGFSVTLRKGSLFLSVGGHPLAYLLDDLQLPLRRELSSNPQILPVTETTAQRYLQSLLEIPASFELLKEDVLFDTSAENIRKVPKGSLVISRSGALVGLMLEDCALPHKGPLSDLEALFQLRTQYQRLPIETLIQRSAKAGARPIAIDKGTFIFTSAGKVYFVYRDGLEADVATLTTWSRESQIYHPDLLEVSKTRGNSIGGPGDVVTLDDLNYLRDVFRQAGTTNIRRETLLLDRNIMYKFMAELPYAHTGKFRHLLGTHVFQLNSAGKGTFSIEVGGKGVQVSELDLQALRKHLLAEGRMLIKMGTELRIRDERGGDWVYEVKVNFFYPYDTFTRPYMEEFIPESVKYVRREEKRSSIIGPQKKPTATDHGAAGEPIADLLAIINNELLSKGHIVFVVDGTLFHWRGRMYRVNEELVYRPDRFVERLTDRDFEALAADWKIHPVVEEGEEGDERPEVDEEEADLEDLPFDTDAVR